MKKTNPSILLDIHSCDLCRYCRKCHVCMKIYKTDYEINYCTISDNSDPMNINSCFNDNSIEYIPVDPFKITCLNNSSDNFSPLCSPKISPLNSPRAKSCLETSEYNSCNICNTEYNISEFIKKTSAIINKLNDDVDNLKQITYKNNEILGNFIYDDIILNTKHDNVLILNKLIWPKHDGKKNQVLQTDGHGNLNFNYINMNNRQRDKFITHGENPMIIKNISTKEGYGYYFKLLVIAKIYEGDVEDFKIDFFQINLTLKNINGSIKIINEDKLFMNDEGFEQYPNYGVEISTSYSNIIVTIYGIKYKKIKWKSEYELLFLK